MGRSVRRADKTTVDQGTFETGVLRTFSPELDTTPSVRLQVLPTNGKFGPATETAVRTFQRTNGLVVDGIVGRGTWTALDAAQSRAPRTPTAPAPAPAPSSAGLTDTQYAQYLRNNFAMLGGRQMVFDSVTVDRLDSGSIIVAFDVGFDEASNIIYSARAADMRAWGRALLQETKAHWPNQPVLGLLSWSYYSRTLYRESKCHYIGDYSTYEGGWFQTDRFVMVSYYPEYGRDSVENCGGS